MARKKIVFVIVEGPSDEDALGAILSKYYDNDEVYVEVMHCDITTENDINSVNIVKRISEIVREYAQRYHFKALHFKKIIHIVDTDGAFVPNTCIVEEKTVEEFIYTENEIKVKNRDLAILRNNRKRQNLLKISRTDTIWNIPYNVYYMSCNLEHVLYNKQNCSDAEKEKLSFDFAKKYRTDISLFLKYICNSNFSVNDDYLLSWKFIEENNNSLNRYTNFGLSFKESI